MLDKEELKAQIQAIPDMKTFDSVYSKIHDAAIHPQGEIPEELQGLTQIEKWELLWSMKEKWQSLQRQNEHQE